MTESRIETLRWLYEVTRESIGEAPADKRSPLIGQLRAIALEMAEMGVDTPEEERTGLIDFQEALAERQQSAPKSSRRPNR